MAKVRPAVRSAEQHRLSVKWSLERLSEGGELRMAENAAFLYSMPATQASAASHGARRVLHAIASLIAGLFGYFRLQSSLSVRAKSLC